jgi:hypothetical protein
MEVSMALRTSFFLLAVCGPGIALMGQNQTGMNAVPGPTSATAAKATPPSATLRPSLDVLKTAVGQLRIDKWKASGPIRDEAQKNLESVQRDVASTLPTLLAAADAAPDSAAKVLPVYRNVEALYDVTLRLVVAARLAAPSDQMSGLDQALARLDDGRHALGDQLQGDADAQEKRVSHLEAALKAVPPPLPPPPPPAPLKCPVTPVKKKKAVTAAKPSTPPASSQSSPTPSH